jgi:cobaltochelatase CobN
MVPPFIRNELTEDLAKLSELLNDHIRNEGTNQQLAEIYGQQARDAAVKLGMAKDLGLDPTANWSDEQLHSVESYLGDLRGQTIPYGLHAFGRTPDSAAIDSTVEAIVSVDRSAMPDATEIFAAEMRDRILQSGPRELDSLMKGLSGKFVPAGKGGEPVRNPDAYPTGANFYGVDPEKMPKPAAWEIGSRLAQQMLDDYQARNGRYPAKVSFVIWGDETMRHEGILESQIFYLLGTKPVWDARGNLVDVAVVPRAELGRPRVDIVIASAAEGMFATLTRMMDTAVQKVKALDEADNQVRQHYLQTRAKLVASGVAPDDADRMAGVRIFDEPPGNFNLNTSAIVGASGSWDSDAGFANDYIRKMGHGYGNGYWGQPMPDVFKMAISGTDTVVHSSSTTLYGAIDNDDMFIYMGGLASAIRGLDGREPELLITDTRDPGQPAMTSVARFVGREFRSRYVNPAWIKGMQKEGYAGAGAMREFIEYLWGWDATTREVVDDAMWQETYETYVEDKQNLGMKDYFEASSPYAYQDITARMIETVRKGYWQADEATRKRLVSEYIDNVAAHGVNCTELSCGNGRMLRYVMDEASRSGVPAPKIAQVRQAFEGAMGRTIEDAARELDEFVGRNDARENAERAANAGLVGQSAPGPAASEQAGVAATTGQVPSPSKSAGGSRRAPELAPPPVNAPLTGQVLAEEQRQTPAMPPVPVLAEQPAISVGGVLWPALAFLLLFLGWRWRELREARAAGAV